MVPRCVSHGFLGRPKALSDKQESAALERLAQRQTVAAIARELNTSRQTIMRQRMRVDVAAAT
ncbi:helix-turn-helix domain-containing protein [Paraburkholderia sp. BR14320]|uniref:helix-turn-helix domain-containing protein n=1 Tax=unclassified Paraburkholderia TaxID=2615204 RepID=UPI0034CFF231